MLVNQVTVKIINKLIKLSNNIEALEAGIRIREEPHHLSFNQILIIISRLDKVAI